MPGVLRGITRDKPPNAFKSSESKIHQGHRSIHEVKLLDWTKVLKTGKPNVEPDNEECAKCNGRCCRGSPGATVPSDWKEPLLKSLIEALKTRLWVVDYIALWEKEVDGEKYFEPYYIRPASKIQMRTPLCNVGDGFWPHCVFHTDDHGCKLPADMRPELCRMTKPAENEEGNCTCVLGEDYTEQMMLSWIPHQDLINEAMDQVPFRELDYEEAKEQHIKKELYKGLGEVFK